MRSRWGVLAAALAAGATTVGFGVVGVVPAGAEASYGPGTYQTGPHNADPSAYESADPATGKVTIFQHNTRQSAAVNCVGDGPRATLLAVHHVTDPVGSVGVAYKDAMLSDHEIVMDVEVTGDRSGVLGHGAAFGPKTNEAGTLTVPLRNRPEPGETMTVQFGLQTGAGCLPHPLIGLDGSRFVNGGQATFTGVSVAAAGSPQRVSARSSARPGAPVPADDITGQNHPADVFAEAWQFIPQTVHVKKGGHLKFGNYDMYPYGAGIAAHSLEEAIPGCTAPPYKTQAGCDSYPRFSSGLVDHGYVHNIDGVDTLPPGSYPFICQVHSQMTGNLIVE